MDIDNKNIQAFVDIANGMNMMTITGLERISDDIDGYIVECYMTLYNNTLFSFFIEVNKEADAKEVSDQLYLIAENLNVEYLYDLEYTDSEIDEIRKTLNVLYKTHLDKVVNKNTIETL